MRKYYILLALLFSFCASSQILLEDNDPTENIQEFARAQIYYNLENPVEFYRLKCQNPTYAEFPGGESAFRAQFQELLQNYLSNDVYAINGLFQFIMDIDASGNLRYLSLRSEVKNDYLLLRDLQLMLDSFKEKWSPALCNGVPAHSKIRLKVSFKTEYFDL